MPVELKVIRKEADRDRRISERHGLVDGRAVDGEASGLTHSLVVPDRLWIPLLGKIQMIRSRWNVALRVRPRVC